ncbi:hypothetical protein UG55_10871, partial [Frankia sp. EI5c]|uniref:alpha/beta hydrolase domain-containing protein n=1 Tax=Frankia sp. EI5c TaxID=683316 RepID=UPI0007C2933C
ETPRGLQSPHRHTRARTRNADRHRQITEHTHPPRLRQAVARPRRGATATRPRHAPPPPGTAQLTGRDGRAARPLPGRGTTAWPGPASRRSGSAYDILTQVARALRGGAGLGGQHPRLLIAAGESQSAFALVAYLNGIQPLTRAFDGFLVHSRGATGLPLVEPGENADLAGALDGTPTVFRTDLGTPVLDLQTESDLTGVLNSQRARQPDGTTFRLWEVAGTAHVATHLLGVATAALDCGVPINSGPLHLVAKAGLRALVTWLTDGSPPPSAPRVEVTDGAQPRIVRNADGIAAGGIRTPPVDLPVAALSGEPGPNPSTICALAGSTRPLPASRLAELYSSAADYKDQYSRLCESVIKDGFVLPEDRPALLALADSAAIPA